MRSRDTSSEAHAVQRGVQRRLGAARRVELAFEMSEQARELSIQGVMAREPGLSQEQARARVLRSLLGESLYDSAWPERAHR
jgi:hypothetical protein